MTRRPAVILAGALLLAGVLLVTAFPMSSWLSQRSELASVQSRLEKLHSTSTSLANRAASLRNDAEIEHLARSEYGLVPKGSRAYVVLPAPQKDHASTGVSQKHSGAP